MIKYYTENNCLSFAWTSSERSYIWISLCTNNSPCVLQENRGLHTSGGTQKQNHLPHGALLSFRHERTQVFSSIMCLECKLLNFATPAKWDIWGKDHNEVAWNSRTGFQSSLKWSLPSALQRTFKMRVSKRSCLLRQWLSNLSLHQNYLEGLLKHRWLGPTSR